MNWLVVCIHQHRHLPPCTCKLPRHHAAVQSSTINDSTSTINGSDDQRVSDQRSASSFTFVVGLCLRVPVRRRDWDVLVLRIVLLLPQEERAGLEDTVRYPAYSYGSGKPARYLQ
jgi:hypothetical protein